MKMIYVSGDDDFAALDFENYFNGKTVKEIINRFIDGKEKHDGDFRMRLYEFGEIDPEFINFVRKNIMDHDDAKHTNFYFEDETIKA